MSRNTLFFLLPISAILITGCASNQTSISPNVPQSEIGQNTAEGIISPTVTGVKRQELTSFINSLPQSEGKVQKIILIEVDENLTSQSLNSPPQVISSDGTDTANNVEPFIRENYGLGDISRVRQLNLGLCGDSATNNTGFYSRRSAEQQYAGFKANIVIPTNFAKVGVGDSLYMYGSIYDRSGSQGVEIGLVWKPSNSKWVAYMSLNGYYPGASSNTTYDSKGVLLPVITYASGTQVAYKMSDFRDVNNPNIFYISANFDGTVVAYRYSSTNDTTQVNPPTNLNPGSGYSRIGVRALTAIANGGQTATGSYMYGGQYASMQLINGVSNGTTNGTTNIDWTSSQTTENCVSNLNRVAASNPVATKIYTDIDLR
jgi:hypothetical protein